MGGNCMDYNTMEEHIYWKCFKTIQFSRTLSGNLNNHLEVPERFVKNLKEKLGKQVSLKAPSGAIWKVVLETDQYSSYFKQGWKKFIEDNVLVENDILIFKYNGSSNFDVLMFDGKSSCEKEASYFVRNCPRTDMEGESRMREKEKTVKISDKVLRGRQSPQNEAVRHVEGSFDIGSASEDDNSMEWIPLKKSKNKDSAGRCNTANMRFHKMKRTAKVRPTSLELKSSRQPVTEEEKANAEYRANVEASDESLVIVMKDYHVYRQFALTLPARWSNKHLPNRSLILNLRLERKVWSVTFCKKTTGGMLYTGWKEFALDNSLEQDDVCLFKLVSAEASPIVIDVEIFRVVAEVVPPTVFVPHSSGRRGRPHSQAKGDAKRKGALPKY